VSQPNAVEAEVTLWDAAESLFDERAEAVILELLNAVGHAVEVRYVSDLEVASVSL